ncbi:MAG: MFS transporter [Streptosporangiaceae bacterium]|nr:MFS transporter [Streptosporangiaceae bacterium]
MLRLRAVRRPEALSGSSTLSDSGVAFSNLALGVLCTLLFLTFLDSTIVSVALGNVQTTLRANVGELQWVVAAYTLTFASIMLACGMIGDELGRKKVMLTGAGVFCAGSVLCALAPNVQVLIAGRAVMGLGAAASEPGTLSMLRHLYPDERVRSRAIGWWAATSGFALAAGPLIGGIIIGAWSWRGIFWFNLAFGLTALIIAAIILPESADPAAARVDTAGTLLGAGALATLVYAVIYAEGAGFAAPVVITMLCVSAVLVTAFVWWERRPAYPLLDLRFFRVSAFTTGNIVAFCTYFATFAIFFFTALYLVEVANASGYRLALVFLPMTALMIVASVLAGRWTTIVSPRWSITAGCVLFAAGLLLANLYLKPDPDYGPLVVALALAGIGIGTAVVPTTSAVMSAVPASRSGMAASSANTSRVIGAALGTAVLGSVVYSQLQSSLVTQMNHLGIPRAFQTVVINGLETGQISGNTAAQYASYGKLVQEVINAAYGAFGDGLHAALYLSAGLALLAGLLSLVTLRSDPGGSDPGRSDRGALTSQSSG